MNNIQPTTVHSLCLRGHTYRLSFLSPHCFRLVEQGRIDNIDLTLPDALSSSGSENVFALENGLIVTFALDGAFEVRHEDQVLLSATMLAGETREGGPSIQEKEGHRGARFNEDIGGLRIENHSPVYGLGERSGPLDKRGYAYINWNTDDPSAHVDTFPSLYQSVPFFLLARGEKSVGVFFDNTSKTRFDVNKSDKDAVLLQFSQGFFDAFFFFGTLDSIVKEYTSFTGRQPLVPYWALGAQQCRWSYDNAGKVEEVINRYAEADIPLSCVYLDIDYMEAYKDFTVDASKFPNVSSWLDTLSKRDIHIIPIIDAGVKAEYGYNVYDEGIARGYFSTLNGEVYHNEVWPGDSVFPAFLDSSVQNWWAEHIAEFLSLGFAGIWNDMNEPASFKGPLPLEVYMGGGMHHDMAHNIYGHSMVKAGALGFEKAGKRLFQLTRAGYAGTCRYSASWAGDNQSIYEHMRLMLPQMMNMSLSGQAYIGVDIGGFGGDATPELLTKWAVAALFNPLYRNHSAIGTKDQEPYRLEGLYLSAYREALLRRYELLPTLYTELFLAEAEGNVVLRPLSFNYPSDPRVINENTEIMLGQNLLLAPSLFPGEQKRSCYFPEPFLHYPSMHEYDAGDHIIDVGIGHIPLFIRKESMILFAPLDHKKAAQPETLRLYLGCQNGYLFHYEDAGDGRQYLHGEYNLYQFIAQNGTISYKRIHQGTKPILKKVDVFNERGIIQTITLDE